MRFLLALLFLLPGIAHAGKTAVMTTDMGVIKFALEEENAPKMVENFIQLATGQIRYVGVDGKKTNKPFYDGLTIHRVTPYLGFFTGCPWGNGRGWPGYMIPEEIGTLKFDRPGRVAMAKILGDKKVGSQFFITDSANERLDGQYPIFGTVTSGMSVVKAILAVSRGPRDNPDKKIMVKYIEIIND